nr:hypothetical protein BCU10_00195 [Vibrio splendidus]
MIKPLSLLQTGAALFSTQLIADSNKQQATSNKQQATSNKQQIVNPIQAQANSWVNIQVAPKIAFFKRWSSTVSSITQPFL